MIRQPIIGQLNNWLSSVSAYPEMSPDLAIRRQVNEAMAARNRPALSVSEWCARFSKGDRDRPVLSFIYQYLGQYSGIDFSRVRPSDRLNGDLHFALVCWFDWTLTFCDDFFNHFGLDLSDRFDESAFETVGDLIQFLTEQVTPQEMTPSAKA